MRTTRWAMVAIAIATVVVATAIPGWQLWLLVAAGVLITYASFGLLTLREE